MRDAIPGRSMTRKRRKAALYTGFVLLDAVPGANPEMDTIMDRETFLDRYMENIFKVLKQPTFR